MMRNIGKVLLTGGIVTFAIGRIIQMRRMPFNNRKIMRMGKRLLWATWDAIRIVFPRIKMK